VASLNTIVQVVANGIGVTLLPRMALEANLLARPVVTPRGRGGKLR
jgi:DNA-binding transcriptional LysR family regulator